MGPCKQADGIVGVPRLGCLTGMQTGGLEVRQEIVESQQPVDQGDHPWVIGKAQKGIALARKTVDPLRAFAFKLVAPRGPRVFPRSKRVDQRPTFTVREDAFQDHIAVAVQEFTRMARVP